MFIKQYKEKRGDKLISEAKELGVETEDIFPTREMGAGDIANARLQERVRSAKNSKYTRLTWIIALISAIASVISAIVAWCAILKK